ncbi:MAG: hypothetical protein PHO03_04580 [Candidatus Omnitrophica bacterium]|nr:hypothetical protein [Candidatus Omnitrophota bacterium]
MSNPRPTIKVMLMCDNVITENITGKNSLIGIFESINAKQFPVVHPSLCVYISFTEALGKYDFRLELISIENKEPVYPGSAIMDLESSDITAYYNLVFRLNMLKFERPGKYEFRLLANGEICEIKTLNVKIS